MSNSRSTALMSLRGILPENEDWDEIDVAHVLTIFDTTIAERLQMVTSAARTLLEAALHLAKIPPPPTPWRRVPVPQGIHTEAIIAHPDDGLAIIQLEKFEYQIGRDVVLGRRPGKPHYRLYLPHTTLEEEAPWYRIRSPELYTYPYAFVDQHSYPIPEEITDLYRATMKLALQRNPGYFHTLEMLG